MEKNEKCYVRETYLSIREVILSEKAETAPGKEKIERGKG